MCVCDHTWSSAHGDVGVDVRESQSSPDSVREAPTHRSTSPVIIRNLPGPSTVIGDQGNSGTNPLTGQRQRRRGVSGPPTGRTLFSVPWFLISFLRLKIYDSYLSFQRQKRHHAKNVHNFLHHFSCKAFHAFFTGYDRYDCDTVLWRVLGPPKRASTKLPKGKMKLNG